MSRNPILMLSGFSNVCDPVEPQSSENPVDPSYFDADIQEGGRNPSGVDEELYGDTAYVFLLAMGVTAVLYFAPSDVSQWDDDEKKVGAMEMPGRYWNNVTHGPVIDTDTFAINYFGHPYFGSVYYVRARHQSKSPQQSLAFSFFMSTVVYEHGIEAFFEKPSLQDLLITPVFGAIWGELALGLEKMIIGNDRKLFASRTLGELGLFLIDPISEIVDPMKGFLGDSLRLRMRKEHAWINPAERNDPFVHTGQDVAGDLVYGLKFVFFREAL